MSQSEAARHALASRVKGRRQRGRCKLQPRYVPGSTSREFACSDLSGSGDSRHRRSIHRRQCGRAPTVRRLFQRLGYRSPGKRRLGLHVQPRACCGLPVDTCCSPIVTTIATRDRWSDWWRRLRRTRPQALRSVGACSLMLKASASGEDFAFRQPAFRARCAVDTLISGSEMSRFLLHSCTIPNTGAALIRRECFDTLGPFTRDYQLLVTGNSSFEWRRSTTSRMWPSR